MKTEAIITKTGILLREKKTKALSKPNCRVRWEVDLYATSIEDAVNQTYALMQVAKRNAPCLTIWLGKKKVEYPVEE